MVTMDYPWAMARLGSLKWWKSEPERQSIDRPILEEDLDRPDPLRVGVHDASRVEWIVTLPLEPREYAFEIEFVVEIPANLITPHDVWGHFQELARLHSPGHTPDTNAWSQASGNDDLRRATLAVIHKLKILQERHGRVCTAANSLILQECKKDVRAELEPLLDEAVALIRSSRDRLAALSSAGASVAESRLADEFLSAKLLDFLSELERDVDGTLVCDGARFRGQYLGHAEVLRKRIASELAAELRRRTEKGFLNPSGDNSAELEEYLERASHLKKHFQEVLFLEMASKTVEGKLRNVVAVVAAAIASTFYFLAMAPGALQTTGISLGTTALIGAFVYALKDRIKEIARGWLSHRILHLYGERTVALRIPARLVKGRPELVSSRDVFTVNYETRHDSLNPEIGATRRLAVLHYKKKGKVEQSATTARELERKGLRSVKQIFRFDLSAVFPRLDDPIKRIPVLDGAQDESVRWVDAPRTYHFPVVARLVTHDTTVEQIGEIVVQKSGIARFDLEDRTSEPLPPTRAR